MRKKKGIFKKKWNHGYIPVLIVLLLTGLFVMPVSAAEKNKVVTLKAGQTCYITSKAKKAGKKAGSVEKIYMEPVSAKTKYDLMNLTPAKKKLNSRLYFEPDRKNNRYYEKIKGNNKITVTCTSGRIRVTIKNYKGQVSIKKSSKLPYEKKILKQGKSMTLKQDLYCIKGKVGIQFYTLYPSSSDVGIDQLVFKDSYFQVKTFASLDDFMAGQVVETNNLEYQLSNGKTRTLTATFPDAGTSILSDKGEITLYRIKQ